MTIIALFHFSLLKYWFCRLNILKNAFPYYCFSYDEMVGHMSAKLSKVCGTTAPNCFQTVGIN
ncbi:hypothetical protein HMPREF3293_01083 [Christensenella minuta]|uniref:Uncharacterized protein n=1 Tax=Christensenella minuta TaxID=626937 RepID=A0A136Q5U5_9FIRM|nr:hypothetical protein HMPREF3293_01083 [Christensenella minuta]